MSTINFYSKINSNVIHGLQHLRILVLVAFLFEKTTQPKTRRETFVVLMIFKGRLFNYQLEGCLYAFTTAWLHVVSTISWAETFFSIVNSLKTFWRYFEVPKGLIAQGPKVPKKGHFSLWDFYLQNEQTQNVFETDNT